jgi:hypothetical protein
MADVWRNALFDHFAPVITSTPKTNGIVGGLYTYDVDAAGYPEPNYILIEHPPGMTIDPNTGLIEWTPLSADDFSVTVKARNDISDANQNFAITVLTPNCDIVFESLETAETMGNATSLIINKPVGAEEGDLLIAILSKDGSGAINTPTRWTLIDEGADAANKIRIGVFYLVAEPSEPNSYTISWNPGASKEAVGAILRYSDVDITGPVNISASSSGSGMSASAPSVTTTVDNTIVLRLVGAAGNTLDATSHPAEHTGRFAITSSGNKISGAAADPNTSQEFAEATGTATFSLLSTGEWRAVTVAIAPARMLIVAGHIKDPRGIPIEGVLVDPNNHGAVADTTDVNGFYELWVDFKWSGIVTPQKHGYYFDPNETSYANVVNDHTDMDFVSIRNEDINIDGFIDELDLWYIAEYWLQPNPPEGDFFDDDFMNFLDFAELADVWGG